MSDAREGVDVKVIQRPAWYDLISPDRPAEHSFYVLTRFPEDHYPAGELYLFGLECEGDTPLRTATDPIWQDYCIRREFPLETPYTVQMTGEWAGVEVDLDKTPRELRLVAPEQWQQEFRAHVWVTFERADA